MIFLYFKLLRKKEEHKREIKIEKKKEKRESLMEISSFVFIRIFINRNSKF
jgi:hypothetical protein